MNTALKVDYRDQQWADLGILKEACIACAETCGAAGAAIVFWLRKIDGERGAFLSSLPISLSTSFLVSNSGSGSYLK